MAIDSPDLDAKLKTIHDEMKQGKDLRRLRLRRTETTTLLRQKLADRSALLNSRSSAAQPDPDYQERLQNLDREISDLQQTAQEMPDNATVDNDQLAQPQPGNQPEPGAAQAADRQRDTTQRLQSQMDARARAAHEQEIARSMKQPPRPTSAQATKSPTGATQKGLGQGAANAGKTAGRLGEFGEKALAAGREAAQVAAQAARVALAALRTAAIFIGRAIMMLLSNPYGWIVLLIIALLIAYVFYNSGSGRQVTNTDGSRTTLAAVHGQNDQSVQQVLAAAGDTQASAALLRTTTSGVKDDFSKLTELVSAYPDSGEKQAVLNQIAQANQSNASLLAAVEQAQRDDSSTTTKGNVKRYPPYLERARTAALTDIDTLATLVDQLVNAQAKGQQ